MSKNDEDADLEAGMTTAERRRRRRKGTGLRVPSDNVPRARTPTGAPSPPVPEDPALAMSIAYSFTSDASGPVMRATPGDAPAPIAPEAAATFIDPPASTDGGGEEFETKTRELHTTDLEAIGTSETSATSPFRRISSPRIDSTEIDVDIDVDDGNDPSDIHQRTTTPMPVVRVSARQATVALSEADIEDLRPATEPGRDRSPRPAPVSAALPRMTATPSQATPPQATAGARPAAAMSQLLPTFKGTASAGPAARPTPPSASTTQPVPVQAPGTAAPSAASAPLAATTQAMPTQSSAPGRLTPPAGSSSPSQAASPPVGQGTSPAASARLGASPAVTTQGMPIQSSSPGRATPAAATTQAMPPQTSPGARPTPPTAATTQPMPAQASPAARSTPPAAATSQALPTQQAEAGAPLPSTKASASPSASTSSAAPPSVGTSSDATSRAAPAPQAAPAPPAVPSTAPESGGAPAARTTAVRAAVAAPQQLADEGETMPLQAGDVEVLTKAPASEEPMSVPDIDVQDLAERAASSGEFEVDVEAEEPDSAAPESDASAEAPRTMPRAPTPPPVPPDKRPSGVMEAQQVPDGQASDRAAATGAHASVPPPPPSAKPPAPPPARKPVPQSAVAAAATKEPNRTTTAGQRQWFMDLFDDDYLRTLPFLTPQATQAEADFVINSMNLAPGAQVLDLGCGYGRHALELAARGYDVVGYDLSTPLLIRGGEEAMRRGLTINFMRGDMRDLDFDKQFDGCYCVFSTFGYFDDDTNKRTLQNVARALKPGGKVLLEILNRDYVISDLPTRVWWEGDGCVVLEEVDLNYFSSRIQVNRSVVFDDGRQLEQEISLRAYSLHEVGKLMHAAGFRVTEVSGGYQMRGRFLGNQSRHIIVLAERKETSGA